MQKITPFLWFDSNAEEAVHFYTSIFKNSNIAITTHYDEATAKANGRKAGSVMTLGFELANQSFIAINGGPVFKYTPAISLYTICENEQEIDELYAKLSQDGSVLMPLQKYPFSKKYGWFTDKYGLSWQLNLADPLPNKISPCLMFVGNQHGKAEEAMNFYVSLFKNSKVAFTARYEAGEPDPAVGTIKHGLFLLEGQSFVAMDSSGPHKFTFNEAFSLLVNCETQEEVDYFWEKLSEGGQEVQCGWLKDKYGVAWQITPTLLLKYIADKDPAKAARVMQAMCQMVKIDIATIQKAYEG